MKRKLFIRLGLVISFVFILIGCNSNDKILAQNNSKTKNSRPQTPIKPYPYKEVEVTYKNTKDNIDISGTLTIPNGAGPFPAVVLITASGPNDRDETFLGHRPFLVLADYLTRNGIAVLRSDDRGVGKTSGNLYNSTLVNLAEDAIAGVELLKKRKEINPNRIGLIGQSEGGTVAPLAATISPDISFVIMMAVSGLPGEKQFLLSDIYIGKIKGLSERHIKENQKINKEIYQLIKTASNEKELKKELKKILLINYDLLNSNKPQHTSKDQNINTYLKMYSNPSVKYSLLYNPLETLKKVKCPILVLFGEKDTFIPPKEHKKGIKETLEESGNKEYKIIIFRSLNHLFQTAKTGLPSEFGQIEETISPKALKTICSWIKEQTNS